MAASQPTSADPESDMAEEYARAELATDLRQPGLAQHPTPSNHSGLS